MAVTEAEIEALLADLARAQQAWIEGRGAEDDGAHMVQAPDMTIFGPFGGEAAVNGPDLAVRQARASAQFEGGTSSHELVQAIGSGDGTLLVLVLIERNEVRFAGHAAPRRWVLRTTQVFRRDGARWLRLHRHADPLIDFRPLDRTLALLPA